MPEPLRKNQRYMPGLDGLRAIAVCAVIAYHLGLSWAPGGLLGVGVFFTLSGYLITDLLLAQKAGGTLRLASFWLARARRLLPALFLMLIVVTIWVAIADRAQLGVVRGQFWAAAIYVSNWWQSFQHVSYFARFGPPSPLNHLWSLSVEEQFYLLWPWLLLLGVHFVPERRRPIPIRPRLAGLTLLAAAVSAIEMAILFHPSFDPSRVYYGTDTRAFGLLIGAALAMVWPSRALTTRVGAHARNILDVAGVCGLLVIAYLIWHTNQYSAWLYRGGIVLLSVATAVVLAALAHPVTRLGRALGWGPLRWVGVRSYGIYLWQTPIIILTTPETNRGVQPVRAVLQVAAILVVSALSWHYVEEPIRHGALGRLYRQARAVQWQPSRIPRRIRITAGVAAAACLLAIVGLAGVSAPSPVRSLVAGIGIQPEALAESPPAQTTDPVAATTRSTSSTTSTTTSRHHSAARSHHPSAGTASTTSTSAQAATGTNASSLFSVSHGRGLKTSCREVVHIGDSTSQGLISSDYLPDPAQRMPAQYARVGVKHSIMEITSATSIVETLPGGTNAHRVAEDLVHSGYHGCWVIALGTNDSADVYVGSSISLAERVKEMMSAIGSQPVMWVEAKTLNSSGPYSESDMQKWNQALVQACARYPHMRVYDWPAAAKDKWFIPDGIHYYSPGYAARAHLFANALARSFPASSGAPPSSCVVSTPSISLPVLGVR